METPQDVFSQEYIVPSEFLFREDWEQIIWDETLRRAHALGKMPVGAIMITHEPGPDVYPSQINEDGSLSEHDKMTPVPFHLALMDSAGRKSTVKINAEVLVGVSL